MLRPLQHIAEILFLISVNLSVTTQLLFPQDSETREVKLLNGIWSFRTDNSTSRTAGFKQKWYEQALSETGDVLSMPVPSSYNDITQDRFLRDFVGWAWYETMVFVPKRWNNVLETRTVLRLESCHYYCKVWINGEKVLEHEGGHLPFEGDVSDNLEFGEENRITVAVNNTLTPDTLPPGSIEFFTGDDKYPPNYFVQNLQMDFFNYAGIHRPVKLYTTPVVYLSDVLVATDLNDTSGIVKFETVVGAIDGVKETDIEMKYELFDPTGESVVSTDGKDLFEGKLVIDGVQPWWPVGMDERPGYLYILKITTTTSNGTQDIYRLNVGIRTVAVQGNRFLINGERFYFKGFGMHEDSNIRGKGLDYALIVKDFNLINWMSANSFRTSHYPYADEIMDLADRKGIVVIDESPGVGIEKENMKASNLKLHKKIMKELVRRDKNHPSVVMWSVANEPRTDLAESVEYFKSIIEYTRNLDPTRPVTFVTNQRPKEDLAVKFSDIISFNRYYAWYHDCGHIEIIQRQFEKDLKDWYDTHRKPIIQMEYGADAVAGLHMSPSYVFTEEYQVDTIKKYFPVFDKYRAVFLVGEMIWNFADFMTAADITRVVGNKKGIFTRDRQPKMAAHILRERYKKLAQEETVQEENNVLRDLITSK